MVRDRQSTFIKARYILKLPATFHGRVKHHWERSQRAALQSDAKMLLTYYVQRKKKRFTQRLNCYLNHAPVSFFEIYFQFASEEIRRLDALYIWRPDRESGAKAILRAALEVDAFIESLSRRVAELASDDVTHEMFENFAERITDKQRFQVQDAA